MKTLFHSLVTTAILSSSTVMALSEVERSHVREEAMDRIRELQPFLPARLQGRVEDRLLATEWQVAGFRGTKDAWISVARYADKVREKFGDTESRILISAQALRRAQDWEGAISRLRIALNRFGTKPAVLLTLAEVEFEAGDFSSAKEHYRDIISLKTDGKFRDYSVLKLAWCELNLNRMDSGLMVLKDLAARDSDGMIRQEALHDMIQFYVMAERHGIDAPQFFSFLEKTQKIEHLTKLAVAFDDAGKFQDSKSLIQDLLKKHSQDLAPMSLLMLGMKAAERTEDHQLLVTRIENIRARLSLKEDLTDITSIIKRVTIKYHNRIVKAPGQDVINQSLPVVKAGYQFLAEQGLKENFGILSEASKLLVEHRELALADQILSTIRLQGHDSMVAWVDVREKNFKNKTPGADVKLLEAYREAIDQTVVKDGPEKAKIIARRVALCQKSGGCNEDLKDLQILMSKYSNTEEASESIPVLSDILKKKNDHETTVAFVNTVKAQGDIQGNKVSQGLQLLQTQAQLQLASAFEAKKDYLKAAEEYVAINASDESRCQSLWNGHVNFERAGRTDRSLEINWSGCEKSDVHKKFVISLSEKLRSLGQYEKALSFYEKIPEGQNIALSLRVRLEPDLRKWSKADLEKAGARLQGSDYIRAKVALMEKEEDSGKKMKIAREIIRNDQGDSSLLARLQVARSISQEFKKYSLKRARTSDVAYVITVKSKKLKEITELLESVAHTADARAILEDIYGSFSQEIGELDAGAATQIQDNLKAILSRADSGTETEKRSPAGTGTVNGQGRSWEVL